MSHCEQGNVRCTDFGMELFTAHTAEQYQVYININGMVLNVPIRTDSA